MYIEKQLNVAIAYNVKPEEDKSFINNSSSHSQPHPDSSFNDTYAEWDTVDTIDAIKDALELVHNVSLVEADKNAYNNIKELNPDIVFNVSEGFNGISRESQIPAMLDMLQIPYTGSDPLTLATCLDKSRTKEILSYHNIPNPNFIIANHTEEIENFNLNFPVIVKPIGEGSSKGIFNSSLVTNVGELKEILEPRINEYSQSFIIEEFLPGREFTVAMLGNNSDTAVLPIVELNFNELPADVQPIYSFEAKWIFDSPEHQLDLYLCPAQISSELEEKIKNMALNAYSTLRCRDWSRIDIRLTENGEPNIIEVNPLPGILPDPKNNSCFPKAARESGLDYNEMINTVLYHAAKRYDLI